MTHNLMKNVSRNKKKERMISFLVHFSFLLFFSFFVCLLSLFLFVYSFYLSLFYLFCFDLFFFTCLLNYISEVDNSYFFSTFSDIQ
uniref:Uncharacterized protein n=1 Tax=Octopus bimaculoides TaxID=37653 RepID=A0A0L8G7Y5_OCTBM